MTLAKPNAHQTIFLVIFFAAFGIATEVFFTAFTDFYNNTPLCGKTRWALAGHSYIWMVFIYGLIPLFGNVVVRAMHKYNIAIRLLLYVSIIYAVEFTSGYALQLLTGKCPWQYTSGWHIMGLIRLDYAPAWLFFAFLLETIYLYVLRQIAK